MARGTRVSRLWLFCSSRSESSLPPGLMRNPRFVVCRVLSMPESIPLTFWQGTANGGHHDDSSFATGLSILFIAQVLSAIMGLYTEETYRIYGPQWKENLFYSHLLSLPLFLPFLPSLTRQFMKLANSAPVPLPVRFLAEYTNLSPGVQEALEMIRIPSQLTFLALNVLTQYACIRGVNLLAAASSALTVTIVLNIRKLVSLLLSIWLFGNRLAPGTLLGAVVVFFAGGLYSFHGKKKPPKARGKAATGAKGD